MAPEARRSSRLLVGPEETATEPSPVFHPSWPRAARTLVRRSIDRHGGWELWSRLEAITLRPASLRGLVP